MSRSQYQYTITTATNAELLKWSDKLFDAMRRDAGSEQRRRRNADGRSAQPGAHRPQEHGSAWRIDAECRRHLNDAFGQRQIFDDFTRSPTSNRVILEASEQYQPRSEGAGKALLSRRPGGGPRRRWETIVHIDSVSAPLSVSHQEQFPAATMSSISRARRVARRRRCRPSRGSKKYSNAVHVVGAFSGDAAEFKQSLASEPYTHSRGGHRDYVCLGVLYESFAHPSPCSTGPCPRRASAALLA